MENERLARYGHHPDPAIDFEVEAESLENIYCDKSIEPLPNNYHDRLARALDFRAGAEPTCVAARQTLLKIDAALSRALTPEEK